MMYLDIEVQLEHLGEIADFMSEWEGRIAEKFKLSLSDIAGIKTQYPQILKLQT